MSNQSASTLGLPFWPIHRPISSREPISPKYDLILLKRGFRKRVNAQAILGLDPVQVVKVERFDAAAVVVGESVLIGLCPSIDGLILILPSQNQMPTS